MTPIVVHPEVIKALADCIVDVIQNKIDWNSIDWQAIAENQRKDDWIPVSERLPDKNMPCLVSVGYFNFTQIAMYSDLMGTIDHNIFWQGDYGKNNFQNITEYVNAWMPLPERYEPKEKENG